MQAFSLLVKSRVSTENEHSHTENMQTAHRVAVKDIKWFQLQDGPLLN